ncbi:MAG: amidohydrolase family protein [Eubacteriales bacterium]
MSHKSGAEESLVRQHLSVYEELQYTYLRDGGDSYGVCQLTSRLAPEYGITYVQPAFPICKQGHYGQFLCQTFADFSEYLERLKEVRQQKGDFVKIMISGLMDFQTYGKVSEPPLEDGEIRDMISAAHDMGFAVMAHCNGSACATAISAGVDSLEHGGYMDEETIYQLAESNTVWVPTLSPVANLIGKSLFPDETLQKIGEMQRDSLRLAHRLGASIALGSDAAAGFVPHGIGGLGELTHLKKALGQDAMAIVSAGNEKIQKKFKPSKG